MGSYQVVKTPGGGYWVQETDAVGIAATAVGTVAGAALGGLFASASRAAARMDYRRGEKAMSAIQDAANHGDWPLAYELSKQFVRHYPQQRAGFEALADAAGQVDYLSPNERLEAASLCEAHGVAREEIAGIRMRAYLERKDMRSLLNEGTVLVGFQGDYKAAGHLARAKALLWLGDLDRALADAEAAVSSVPDWLSYAMRADVLWARGELARAAADYQFAVRLRPGDRQLKEKQASLQDAISRQGGAPARSRTPEDARPTDVDRRSDAWMPTYKIPKGGLPGWESIEAASEARLTNSGISGIGGRLAGHEPVVLEDRVGEFALVRTLSGSKRWVTSKWLIAIGNPESPSPADAEPHWVMQEPQPPVAPPTAAMKVCPMCAEDVRAAARICRYCRYEFPGADGPLPSTDHADISGPQLP